MDPRDAQNKFGRVKSDNRDMLRAMRIVEVMNDFRVLQHEDSLYLANSPGRANDRETIF
jgi:hypothetical protein